MSLAGGLQKLASLLTGASYDARWLLTNHSPHARLQFCVLCAGSSHRAVLVCRAAATGSGSQSFGGPVSLLARYLVPDRFLEE